MILNRLYFIPENVPFCCACFGNLGVGASDPACSCKEPSPAMVKPWGSAVLQRDRPLTIKYDSTDGTD